MDFFGGGNENRFKKIESQIVDLNSKLLALTAEVERKTQDYELDAKESAEKAKQYESDSKAANDNIISSLDEATSKLLELRTISASAEELKSQIDEYNRLALENSNAIATSYQTAIENENTVTTKLNEIEELLKNKPEWESKINTLNEIFKKADENDSKINGLSKNIADRKKEIDNIYYEIFGQSQINEDTGEEEFIGGKKAELDNAYTQLKSDLANTDESLAKLKNDTEASYQLFIENKSSEFDKSHKAWDDEYSTSAAKIRELLPNALTAGLSSAYRVKREEEEIEYKRLRRAFGWGIFGLILVSMIPIAFSINSIIENEQIKNVIFRIPRIVVAILPLYIPVLWVAYSANKKRNLSKRLIEEYSHKETLSKTFEGLSTQIDKIEDKKISSELRNNLLYNLLEVNSQNPGKLISDYDKSDHPLMDALDKSVKLTNAITKLANIPGFNKLAASLGKKAEKILENESQKANAGIDAVTEDTTKKD